jgi:hypothetical protein
MVDSNICKYLNKSSSTSNTRWASQIKSKYSDSNQVFGLSAALFASDGRPTTEWSDNMQPGVLLVYTSTIANALLAIAFAEAVVIGYWARALRGVPVSYHPSCCAVEGRCY